MAMTITTPTIASSAATPATYRSTGRLRSGIGIDIDMDIEGDGAGMPRGATGKLIESCAAGKLSESCAPLVPFFAGCWSLITCDGSEMEKSKASAAAAAGTGA